MDTITIDRSLPPPVPVIVAPASGSTVTTIPRYPHRGGRSTVTVIVDGISVGTAQVAVNGTWSLTLSEPLSSSAHTIAATATVSLTSAASAAKTFTVDVGNAPGGHVTQGSDDLGQNLWSSYTNYYDTQGRLTVSAVTNDDGTRVLAGLDAGSQFAWKDYLNVYDSQRRLTDFTVRHDDGTRSVFGHDAARKNNWPVFVGAFRRGGDLPIGLGVMVLRAV